MEREQRVLIVDDDHLLGKSMGRVFQRAGYQVAVCVSGQEALQLLLHDRFDVIITDYQMPMMDGIELTSRLRQAAFGATIVGMSCYEAGDEFRRAGADAFFRKPIMPDMLYHLMTRQAVA
jgi:CheY-like chemotaxis protein